MQNTSEKRSKVAMGPIQDINLCVASAFYLSQVDLCGTFNAYSNANKKGNYKSLDASFLLLYYCKL